MNWHKRFFWLLLLFLPTQLGVHFWPQWAMVLGRRVDYLSPTFYLTDTLIIFTVGLYISSTYAPSFRTKRERSEKSSVSTSLDFSPSARNDSSNMVPLFFLGLLLFVVANIFMATNPVVAVYKWVKVAEFVLLGWYVVRTKPPFSFFLFPFSIGILYSSILAISQFILQHSVGGPLWWLGERTFSIDTPGIARIALRGRELLRPYGTFPHPNVLGGFLAVVLPLVLMSLMSPMGRMSQMKKRVYGAAFAVGAVALLLTFSRSAIVVGILALACVFFKKKRIFFSLAILFLAFSFFHFPFTFSEESFVVRWQLNSAAIHLWQTSPLFGVGLGNFLVRLPEALPTRTIYFLQPVHNIYLLLLSEVGIAGAALILWLAWLLVKSKTSKTSRTSQEFILVLLVPLLTLLLLGLVDHYPLTLQQGQLLLTLLIATSLR